jgi:hypothetical protein
MMSLARPEAEYAELIAASAPSYRPCGAWFWKCGWQKVSVPTLELLAVP